MYKKIYFIRVLNFTKKIQVHTFYWDKNRVDSALKIYPYLIIDSMHYAAVVQIYVQTAC